MSDFEIVFEDKLKVGEGFCPPGNGGTEGGVKTIEEPKGVIRLLKQEQKKCLHLLCLARRRKTKSTAKKNPKDGKTLTLEYSII